ncbi:partial RecBCD enzyme subunit RecD, partial [biofilm metagenome]
MSLANDIERTSRLDLAFANFLSQRTTFQGADKKQFATILALLSHQQRQGHTCIEISKDDKDLLLGSGFACLAAKDGIQPYPLIIEDNRLYLQRYWCYEDRLTKQISQLAQKNYDTNKLDTLLDRYFPSSSKETDWQREAASLACQQAFTIITGGPGTGKTTTVCKILALLQELVDKPLLIALAAPTGKAAMRLQEAIVHNLALLGCPQTINECIPQSAATLHRLLGANPPSPYFKHHADNPLVYDLIVVDEASMVDLALMSKLVDALKPGARLILLGDKDQLSSVESGAVLADLIAGLPHNTVELTQSYRFDEGIKKLADAVNRQDHDTAWALLSARDGMNGLIDPMRLMPYIMEQRQEYLHLVKAGADFTQ